jgi:hypothetical protein
MQRVFGRPRAQEPSTAETLANAQKDDSTRAIIVTDVEPAPARDR